MRYVTYDPATGALNGAYLQDLRADHAGCHIEVGEAIYDNWTAYRLSEAGDELEPIPPGAPAAPTEAETVSAYMAAVQQHMDERAVAFGYDNLISVITYAEEPAVARYQTEGQAFRAWRSACWYACEQMLVAVKTSSRTAPTHAELIDELPVLDLPPPAPLE